MARGVHSRDELAEFIGGGETRLIAAAYRDPTRSADLYIMEDNTAADIREWARSALKCPIPDCTQPQLKTVARTSRRDGFSHLPGAHKHTPESINHIQGKAVIARWLSRLIGEQNVRIEAPIDSAQTRIADVLATLPTGRRVAFEVQYSPITVREWQERHESYRAKGITDVWLWGHTWLGKYQTGSSNQRFPLSEAQMKLVNSDLPLTYLNPISGQVGIATNNWERERVLAYQSTVTPLIRSLDSFRVSTDGLDSSVIRALRASSERRRLCVEQEEIERRRELVRLGLLFRSHVEERIEEDREAKERARQRQKERAEARQAWREAEAKRVAEARRKNQARSASAALPLTTAKLGGPWAHCLRCGNTLAEAYAKIGYHTMCNPNYRQPDL